MHIVNRVILIIIKKMNKIVIKIMRYSQGRQSINRSLTKKINYQVDYDHFSVSSQFLCLFLWQLIFQVFEIVNLVVQILLFFRLKRYI